MGRPSLAQPIVSLPLKQQHLPAPVAYCSSNSSTEFCCVQPCGYLKRYTVQNGSCITASNSGSVAAHSNSWPGWSFSCVILMTQHAGQSWAAHKQLIADLWISPLISCHLCKLCTVFVSQLGEHTTSAVHSLVSVSTSHMQMVSACILLPNASM